MNGEIHLSIIENGTIVIHMKGIDGSEKVPTFSKYYDPIKVIMNKRRYLVVVPENVDYNYLQKIFIIHRLSMTMGYWKNTNTNKATKMHVLTKAGVLCKTRIGENYPIFMGSEMVAIDFITCSKCLDQYCRIIGANKPKEMEKVANLIGPVKEKEDNSIGKKDTKVLDMSFDKTNVDAGYWSKTGIPDKDVKNYHIRYKSFPLCDPDFNGDDKLVYILRYAKVGGISKHVLCKTCLEIYTRKATSKSEPIIKYLDVEDLPPIRLGI